MGAVSESGSDRAFNLLTLPGDGIGPEVIDETLKVVAAWWVQKLLLFGGNLCMPCINKHTQNAMEQTDT